MLRAAFLFFIILSAASFSCNGQVNASLPADSASEKISPGAQTKLIKTQGTNEYANTRCGLMDKAGQLWFGTSGEGAYRYNGKLFTQFTTKDGLNSNTILSVMEDHAGNIWFGTDSGLCCYDGKLIRAVPIAVAGKEDFTNRSVQCAVWSMLQDKSGKFWFGTSEGMYCYDGIFFTRFLDDENIKNESGLHLKMVDCIYEDKTGNIWFASGMPPGEEGVCCYDGKALTAFKPNGNGWVRTIIEDKDGNLCFATRHSGVCRYNPVEANGKNVTNFTEQAGINNGSVTSVFKDKAGNIWITTELASEDLSGKGGLWRYDGASFTQLTVEDGLTNDDAWCVVEDRNGAIWVGTRDVGLYRYDGKNFTRFSE